MDGKDERVEGGGVGLAGSLGELRGGGSNGIASSVDNVPSVGVHGTQVGDGALVAGDVGERVGGQAAIVGKVIARSASLTRRASGSGARRVM